MKKCCNRSLQRVNGILLIMFEIDGYIEHLYTSITVALHHIRTAIERTTLQPSIRGCFCDVLYHLNCAPFNQKLLKLGR